MFQVWDRGALKFETPLLARNNNGLMWPLSPLRSVVARTNTRTYIHTCVGQAARTTEPAKQLNSQSLKLNDPHTHIYTCTNVRTHNHGWLSVPSPPLKKQSQFRSTGLALLGWIYLSKCLNLWMQALITAQRYPCPYLTANRLEEKAKSVKGGEKNLRGHLKGHPFCRRSLSVVGFIIVRDARVLPDLVRARAVILKPQIRPEKKPVVSWSENSLLKYILSHKPRGGLFPRSSGCWSRIAYPGVIKRRPVCSCSIGPSQSNQECLASGSTSALSLNTTMRSGLAAIAKIGEQEKRGINKTKKKKGRGNPLTLVIAGFPHWHWTGGKWHGYLDEILITTSSIHSTNIFNLDLPYLW